MTEYAHTLADRLQQRFKAELDSCKVAFREVTLEVKAPQLLSLCQALREEAEFGFEQLIDLCGVDYLHYGVAEWATDNASNEGFSRGVSETTSGRFSFNDAPGTVAHEGPRYAVVYHLLSVANNQRLRIKCYCTDDEFPVIASVNDVWNSANWFEREAFDLFGIIFEGHPDLRRILTDYGFVGHPFRKDFPLIGNVEMRYDPEQRRVIYEPVSIEPRVLVPKVIRDDHRYVEESAQEKISDA